MKVLRLGLLYFALVFAAGFILGVPRTLWLEPRMGGRWAQLLELPVMIAVMAAVAGGLVRRWLGHEPVRLRLAVGGVALLCMVLAELLLGLALRDQTPGQVILERDPVAGAAFALALLLMAVLPVLPARPR